MLVVIRGAGDIASGIAARLWRSGIDVVMTEIEDPTAIRRTVAFSEAIRTGETTVEDISAKRAENAEDALSCVAAGFIPILPDPGGACISELQPDAVVDAILAKKNTGTGLNDAPVVVAVGPGFTAGRDCDAVVETKRGHNLGRVYLSGAAAPNTGIPGIIAGIGEERVIRAPRDGVLRTCAEIGQHVEAGDAVASVNGEPVLCRISGVLRGLLPDGAKVHKGMKSGDVDPRDDASYCGTISDKALAVGGGVLEAVLGLTGAAQRGLKRPVPAEAGTRSLTMHCGQKPISEIPREVTSEI